MLAVSFFSGLTVVQIAFLIGITVPVAVALVTKSSASSLLKGTTLAVLAGVAAIVAALTGTDKPIDVTLGFCINVGFPAFISAVTTYFGLLKYTNMQSKLLPTFGIGKAA